MNVGGLSATTFCVILILGICIGYKERNGLILLGVGIALFLFTYCVRMRALRRIFRISTKEGENVEGNQPFILAFESCKNELRPERHWFGRVAILAGVLLLGVARGRFEAADFARECAWVNEQTSGKTMIEARVADIRWDGSGGTIILLDQVYELIDTKRVRRWNGVIYSDEWPEEIVVGRRMVFRGKPTLYSCKTNPGMADQRENYRAKKIGWYSSRMKAVEEASLQEQEESGRESDGASGNRWIETFVKCKEQLLCWKDSAYELVRGGIWRFRMHVSEQIDEGGLAQPYRGLCKTLLLGERELLDSDTRDLFSEGGIAHVLSVSGLHLGIVGMGLYRLLRRKPFLMPRGICAVICTLVMGLYVEMTGSSVSGERALIQMCLYLLGEVLGRPAKSSNSLAWAAMYVLMEQPRRLFSAGFLYSFASVAVIHICVPQMQKWMQPRDPARVPLFEAPGRSKWEKRLGRWLRHLSQNLVFGACLALGNYPITVWFYYEYPLSSMAANLLLVPLVVICWYGFAMYSLLVLIPGCINMARFAAYPACIILDWMMRMLAVDGTKVLILQTGRPLLWQMCLYLGVVFAILGGIVLANTVWEGKKEAAKICERYVQDLQSGMRGEFPAVVYIPYWLLLHGVEKNGAYMTKKRCLLPELYELPYSKGELKEHYKVEFLLPFIGKAELDNLKEQMKRDVRHALIRFACWSILAVCMLVVRRPKGGGLTYYFLDVGQGDCCAVTFPDGTIGLVDCGSSSVRDVGIRRLIPFLKYLGYGNSIDYVWLSHFDGDHMSGIQDFLMEGGDVKHFYVASDPFSNEKMSDIMEKLSENGDAGTNPGTFYEQLSKNYETTIGGVRVSCVYPVNRNGTGDNDDSMVLTCAYEGSLVVFAGDISSEGGEADLTQDQGFCELLRQSRDAYRVLKVAHHGSKYSSCEAFIEAVAPDLAVISVGEGNRYGHPAKETLERLRKGDTMLVRTDQQGAVLLSIEPTGKIIVKCCRQEPD